MGCLIPALLQISLSLSSRCERRLPFLLAKTQSSLHGKEFFRLASERGLEGIVAKDKQSPYLSGRETSYWLKIKNPTFERKDSVEFRVARRRG